MKKLVVIATILLGATVWANPTAKKEVKKPTAAATTKCDCSMPEKVTEACKTECESKKEVK